MNGTVVADANIVVSWLIPVDYSPQAHALRQTWEQGCTRIAAPCLLRSEVANAIHRYVVQQIITLDRALELIDRFLEQDIEIIEAPNLCRQALELSSALNQRAAYDCHYLALAQSLNCEFWTADRRFYNTANQSYPRVRWIGEFRPEATAD